MSLVVVDCASVYVCSYLEFVLDFLSKLSCVAQNLCPAPDSATSLHPIAETDWFRMRSHEEISFKFSMVLLLCLQSLLTSAKEF